MIFGKHINRYYLKYAPMLLLGVLNVDEETIMEDFLLTNVFFEM